MFLRALRCIRGLPTGKGPPCLGNRPRDLVWLLAALRKIGVLPPLLWVKVEIIFSTLRIPADQMHQPARVQGFRNILPPSNAPFARKDLPGHTIYAPICVHTLMSVPLCVPFVGRPLQDNTIASAMRDCTVVRRSLFAKANFAHHLGRIGDAGVDLQEPMRLVDISAPKQEGFVLNLYWKRRGWRDRTGQ